MARALGPLRDDPAHAAVLLDFDGTLSPIVPRPEDAVLVEGAREAITALVGRYGLVGFVSGRGLADLEARVAIPGLAYAGNHGMELRRADGARLVDPAAEPWVPRIGELGRVFDAEALDAEGVTLEDKVVTLSFHTRRAPDPARAERFLETHVVPAAEALGLRPTPGRKVLEIRPPVRVDKGTAARALVEAADVATATYIGDDRTDADAWRALRELRETGHLRHAAGVAAVGDEVPEDVRAASDAVVDGPAGAVAVLRWLAEG